MALKQIDCFKINSVYWNFLGFWPTYKYERYYKYYSAMFIGFFDITYIILMFTNMFFLPRQLDILIEELIFIFTEVSILSKVLTFVFMREKIELIFEILDNDTFQPDEDHTLKIVQKAKWVTVMYWKIIAVISYSANLIHVLTPLFSHLILSVQLELPVCSYSFLPESIKERFIYLLYLYQAFGMHFHMLNCINIDGLFVGLIILVTAQCEVLSYKLRNVTDYGKNLEEIKNRFDKKTFLKLKLDKCIKHFDEIARFCSLVEDVFSATMFVLTSMSSCIICVCLFRFTLPATSAYFIFLSLYMTVMTVLIIVPCWVGTRLSEASSSLSIAIYNCDWTTRPRQFKSSMQLFVERMNRPLSIIAMKMFPLSLVTFTKIMNTAYSFFTLLRHMQTREA